MSEFIVMSPVYELLRYGHGQIKKQVDDAHALGKLAKFVYGPVDLKDPSKPPTPDNYRFEPCQAAVVDIVVFVDKKDPVEVEGEWGRRKKRVLKRTKEE